MAATVEGDPDLTLGGVATESDHETYIDAPFEVPAGVTRLTINFDYSRAHRTVLDLGLLDPDRFRGWSGGERRSFTLSAEEATASYLLGPIVPGRWTLLIGVPNIRKGVTAAYEARIWFGRGAARPRVSTFSDRPLKSGPAWWRGDLHMHTAHSDGSCCAQSGTRAPAPLYRTVEAAAARGLDFIAITDHNTTSHFHAMRELQPTFDRLLLIPGREITTFFGHANIFGPTGFIDFRLGSASLPNAGALIDSAAAMSGLLSVCHPSVPSGEACMGCGWTAPDTDFSRVEVIEVVNGGATRAMGGNDEGPFSGIPFWHERLNQSLRITGVGGSDNHDPSLAPEVPSAVGKPTTVIEAAELSETAILAAIRAGRVAIDLDGTANRTLDLVARAAGESIAMGGSLAVGQGQKAEFEVLLSGLSDGRVEAIRDGEVVAETTGDGFELIADGAAHWVRVNIRAADGRLLMIGNPIYLTAG